jgi:nitrite reductase (NADH) small subunit
MSEEINSVANGESTWIRVAPCEDVPIREGRCVRLGSLEIALFNMGDRFLAVENRCPHKGGPLAEGIVSGATVVCPLHAWRVELGTGCVARPANVAECVATFRTRVEDGVVLLEVPARALAAAMQAKEEAARHKQRDFFTQYPSRTVRPSRAG